VGEIVLSRINHWNIPISATFELAMLRADILAWKGQSCDLTNASRVKDASQIKRRMMAVDRMVAENRGLAILYAH